METRANVELRTVGESVLKESPAYLMEPFARTHPSQHLQSCVQLHLPEGSEAVKIASQTPKPNKMKKNEKRPEMSAEIRVGE